MPLTGLGCRCCALVFFEEETIGDSVSGPPNLTGIHAEDERFHNANDSRGCPAACRDDFNHCHFDSLTSVSYYFGSENIIVYSVVAPMVNSISVALPPSETGWFLLARRNHGGRLFCGGFIGSVSCAIPPPCGDGVTGAWDRACEAFWPLVFVRGGTSLILKKTTRNIEVFNVLTTSDVNSSVESLHRFLPPFNFRKMFATAEESDDDVDDPQKKDEIELDLYRWISPSHNTDPSMCGEKHSVPSEEFFLPIDETSTLYTSVQFLI